MWQAALADVPMASSYRLMFFVSYAYFVLRFIFSFSYFIRTLSEQSELSSLAHWHIKNHRIFKVAIVIIANKMPTIKNRVTILLS